MSLNSGIRCITLSRPVVLRGRICIASARESRHDTPTLEEGSSGSQTAFLLAHSEHDFDRTAAPADRYMTGSFRGQTLTPASFFQRSLLSNVKIRDQEQGIRFQWSSAFDIRVS
jgi:hypothetical protein